MPIRFAAKNRLTNSNKTMAAVEALSLANSATAQIHTLWRCAVERSGIENANVHDIRAKSSTDAKKQGVDSMALLGHKSESVHQRYLRNKESPVVQGIKVVAKS